MLIRCTCTDYTTQVTDSSLFYVLSNSYYYRKGITVTTNLILVIICYFLLHSHDFSSTTSCCYAVNTFFTSARGIKYATWSVWRKYRYECIGLNNEIPSKIMRFTCLRKLHGIRSIKQMPYDIMPLYSRPGT